MIVNTLAPEIFMCIPMTQFLEAKIVLRKIDKYCDKYQELNPHWDITQALYFNMGLGNSNSENVIVLAMDTAHT